MALAELLKTPLPTDPARRSEALVLFYAALTTVCADPARAPSAPDLCLGSNELMSRSVHEQVRAFMLRLSAYRTRLDLVGDAELEDCALRASWALEQGSDIEEALVTALVEDVCWLALRKGAAQSVINLAEGLWQRPAEDAGVATMRRWAAATLRYDAMYEVAERDQHSAVDRRITALNELHGVLQNELQPALEDMVLLDPAGARLEIERLRMQFKERDLSARLAAARGELARVDFAAWRALSDRFLGLGERGDASRALLAGIGRFLDLISLAATERHRSAVHEVLRHAASLEDRSAPPPDRWRCDLVAVRARLRLGDSSEAAELVQRVMAELMTELAGSQDEIDRSSVISAANDWLGVCLRLDAQLAGCPGPGSHYKDFFRALRGKDFEVAMPARANRLRLLAHRTGSVFECGFDGAISRWCSTAKSGVVVEASQDLLARANELVTVWELDKSKPPPNEPTAWDDLLEKLAGCVGLFQARDCLTGDVSILAESSNLPLLASALHVAGPHSVLGIRAGLEVARPEPPTGDDAVLFLQGFAPSVDDLARSFRRLAGRLNCTVTLVNSIETLREALEQPARLIVLGCHGKQRSLLGHLKLTLGTTSVRAEDALGGVVLPRSSAVVALTCDAGGGWQSALGESDSVTDLFLQAGACAVVASRWPAWIGPLPPLSRMLREATAAAVEASPVRIARAVVEMVTRLRGKGLSPAWWAGWNAWAAVPDASGEPAPGAGQDDAVVATDA